MGELITERITANARELKLLGLADTADELVDRAETAKLGYRASSSTSSWKQRSGCSRAGATPPG
jgi:hypothetical protein